MGSSQNPVRVVLFTGGRGSSVLSRELIRSERIALTLAINGYDDGLSTGEVRRFLGIDLDFGKRLGLSPDWTQRIIKQVGNYGELFDRNLGLKSPLKLERRLNNLASNGGLHYAPSFR